MKTTTVPFSQITSHPFHSLNPADYIGEPARLKELLQRFSPNDQKILRWMLQEEITTADEIQQLLAENEENLAKTLAVLREKNAAKLAALEPTRPQ
jgi:hypothetical protein